MRRYEVLRNIVIGLVISTISAFSIGAYSNNILWSQSVSGVVFHDVNRNGTYDAGIDIPIADVAVSNGRDVTVTNSDGRYELSLENNTSIFVIKPRNWMLPVNELQLPEFYYVHSPEGLGGTRYRGLEPTGTLPASVDFPLYPHPETDKLDVLVFGDTQARNFEEIYFMNNDVVANLVGIETAFGITLGDVVFDDLHLFEPHNQSIAKIGIPWFNILGNHDIDFTAEDDIQSRGAFFRNFGPTYYSFTWGPAHFIVVDNIVRVYDMPNPRYRTGLGEDQLQFIRNEFSRIPDDQLVVLLTHIPWLGATPWKDNTERDELFSLLATRPNSITFAAHTHRHYHHFIGDEDGIPGQKPHHMISMATVCGAWWAGAPDEYGIPHAMMSDGTPNSYGILEIHGNNYRLNWRASRRPSNFQMHVHAEDYYEAGSSTPLVVTANIFNALPDAKVTVSIEGTVGEAVMNRVDKRDPVREASVAWEASLGEVPWRQARNASPSPHIWEATLEMPSQEGVYLIVVSAKDDWHEYSGKKLIHVR
jgi:hypothetical protein